MSVKGLRIPEEGNPVQTITKAGEIVAFAVVSVHQVRTYRGSGTWEIEDGNGSVMVVKRYEKLDQNHRPGWIEVFSPYGRFKTPQP